MVPFSCGLSVGLVDDLVNLYCCSLICESSGRSIGRMSLFCSILVCSRVMRSCLALAAFSPD